MQDTLLNEQTIPLAAAAGATAALLVKQCGDKKEPWPKALASWGAGFLFAVFLSPSAADALLITGYSWLCGLAFVFGTIGQIALSKFLDWFSRQSPDSWLARFFGMKQP